MSGHGWAAQKVLAIAIYVARVNRDIEQGCRSHTYSGERESTDATVGNLRDLPHSTGSLADLLHSGWRPPCSYEQAPWHSSITSLKEGRGLCSHCSHLRSRPDQRRRRHLDQIQSVGGRHVMCQARRADQAATNVIHNFSGSFWDSSVAKQNLAAAIRVIAPVGPDGSILLDCSDTPL